MILLLLGKEKPWTGLAINRKKAKAMAGVMMITPHSGHKAEVQRHQGLAETSALWLLAPCWCSFPGVTEKKETVAGFLHAAEHVFGRTLGIKPESEPFALGSAILKASHLTATQARNGPSLVLACIDFFPGKQGISCLTPPTLVLAKMLAMFLTLADDVLCSLF